MLFISIAGLTFSFDIPAGTQIDQNFEGFICEPNHSECKVCFDSCETLPELNGELLYSEIAFDVLRRKDGTIFRRFHKHLQEDQFYAYSVTDRNCEETTVYYLADCPLYLRNMSQCFSLSNWEKLLIHHGRIILHSALIRSRYGGIAFMGPSGIGKSTQASLWADYENADLINGDKPVYFRSENGWQGCGAPFAGSSHCYVNEEVPINAIVILGQGSSCTVSRLSLSEAFRQVYSNCTAYCWDPEFMSQAVTLISDLISEVTVYHLICTPDQSAVETIKNAVLKGSCYERD